MSLYVFIALLLGLITFAIIFFKSPKYAIIALIIAKPIIDTTWNQYIIFEINFLKLYAGLFVLIGIIYIIIKKIPILSFRDTHYALRATVLLWLLFIASTFTSVFIITGFHYLIVQLKYMLSVASGFIMFILAMHIFDPDKDKGFFIKTFLIAGIFPMLLWLIPIILGTQIYSNDELLRVQGPYQNFWQFGFAGLQTLIFCLAYLSHCGRSRLPGHCEEQSDEAISSSTGSSPNPSAPAVTSSPKDSIPAHRAPFLRKCAQFLSVLNLTVILMLIISLIMLWHSHSKAFWLAGVLVLVTGFILMRKYIFAALVPVILVILFFIPPINKNIKKTFSNEIGYYVNHSVPKQRILRGRAEVWKQALGQYLNLPFLKRVFGMGITQGILSDDGVENDYLRVFVEQGFVGFLIYFGLLIIVIVLLFKTYLISRDPITIAALLSMISLLVLSIGANPLLIPNTQWLFWGSAGLAMSRKRS